MKELTKPEPTAGEITKLEDALDEALKNLKNERQRQYVELLPKCNYVPLQVMRVMNAQDVTMSTTTLYRWAHDPLVRAAVKIQRELACELAGIDVVSVMTRIEDWARYCSEEVDCVDSFGKPTGQKRRRDPTSALKALELLGRHVNAFKEDQQSSRAVVHLVNLAGPMGEAEEPIDGEYEEIER